MALTVALAGQSNMAGRGAVSGGHGVPYAWDAAAVARAGNAAEREPGVVRLSAAGLWEPAREPLHADIDTDKVCGVGPGLAFARELRCRLGGRRELRLIPCAVGGSALREWTKGAKHYEALVERTQKHSLDMVLWYQGETDALDAEAASSYATRLREMMDNLRMDLGLPQLPFVLVCPIGVPSKLPFIDIVREQVAAVAEQDPHAFLVDLLPYLLLKPPPAGEGSADANDVPSAAAPGDGPMMFTSDLLHGAHIYRSLLVPTDDEFSDDEDDGEDDDDGKGGLSANASQAGGRGGADLEPARGGSGDRDLGEAARAPEEAVVGANSRSPDAMDEDELLDMSSDEDGALDSEEDSDMSVSEFGDADPVPEPVFRWDNLHITLAAQLALGKLLAACVADSIPSVFE